MAQFTITIPDDLNIRMVTALCSTYGYNGTDANGNPQTQGAFAFEQFVKWGSDIITAYEKKQAMINAANSISSPDVSGVSFE